MTTSRTLLSALAVCAVTATLSHRRKWKSVTGEGSEPGAEGDRNWVSFPPGASGARRPVSTSIRKTATSGPTSGGGAGTAGGGPVDCDNTPLDPISSSIATPRGAGQHRQGRDGDAHGIHVDKDGNVWIADFANNKEGTKDSRFTVQLEGRELLSLGVAGKRARRTASSTSQRRRPGPDGSILCADGHDAQA